jgi:hypothetical protein
MRSEKSGSPLIFSVTGIMKKTLCCARERDGESDDEAFGTICVFQELIYHTSFGWATPGGFVSLLKIMGEFEG